jgi:hypothetical protein
MKMNERMSRNFVLKPGCTATKGVDVCGCVLMSKIVLKKKHQPLLLKTPLHGSEEETQHHPLFLKPLCTAVSEKNLGGILTLVEFLHSPKHTVLRAENNN